MIFAWLKKSDGTQSSDLTSASVKAGDETMRAMLDALKPTFSDREIEGFIAQRTDMIIIFLQRVRLDTLSWIEKKRVTFLAERFRGYWLRRVSLYSKIGELGVKSSAELRQVSTVLQECVSALQPIHRWLNRQDLPRLRYQKLAVAALLAEREGRPHLQVASLWRKAGDELRRNPVLWPRFGKVPHWAAPFRENCLYKANILEGFHFLGAAPVDLFTTVRKLEIALNHAESAAKRDLAFKHNVNYVSYWLGVFRLRWCILMNKWEDARNAVHAVKEAAIQASIFPADEFRPHYYLGVDDIENEQFLIDAMASLAQKNLSGAIEKLEDWLTASEVYLGTWRYANVEVRKRALCVLSGPMAGAMVDHQQLKEVRKLIKKWQPGATCKRIHQVVSKATHSWNKSRDVSTILSAVSEIQSYMPLDTWVEAEKEGDEEYKANPMDYLPPHLSQQLDSCFPLLANSQNAQLVGQRLRQIVASYLAVIAEYHAYRDSSRGASEKVKLREDLNKILLDVAELVKFIKGVRRTELPTLDSLAMKVSDILEGATVAKVEDAVTYFRDDVIPETSMNMYPLVIRISVLERQLESKGGYLRFYKAHRLQKLSGETPFIMICGYQDLLLRNFYYLPPGWKRQRYHRASYPLFRPGFPIEPAIIYRQLQRHLYPWSGWEEWTGDLEELRRELEGPQLEFKGPAEPDLLDCLTGLSNAQGGHLVIGLSDKFNAQTGLRDVYGVTPEKAEQIWNGLVTGNRGIRPRPMLYDCFHKPVDRARKSVLIFYVHRAPPDQEEPYHIERKVAFREGASTQTYDVETNADDIRRLWNQNRQA